MEQVVPGRKVVRVSKKGALIALVLAVIIAGFMMSRPRMIPVYDMMGINGVAEAPSMGRADIDASYSEEMGAPAIYRDMPYPYPYDDGENTIEDTREFLKVSYWAQILTRDVSETVSQVRAAVEIADGRVDGIESSERYGYVRFVIPKSNLYQFTAQIKGITWEGLYTENISSQNLLGEKQNIEEREESLTETLARLKSEKSALDAQHAQRLATINRDLATTQAELVLVRQKISKEKDANDLVKLRTQEATLVTTETTLIQSRNSENTTYTKQSQSLTNQIANAENGLEQVAEDDEQFDNKVETVTGTVNVQWASYWQMSKAISPIHPGFIIAILVLLALRFMYKRGQLPLVEFV